MTYDFGIVIPHLDETRFLEVCLRSILFQEGEATAHVHIQDGGTGTNVAGIVEKLRAQMDSKRFGLTHTQEPDTSAADAINKGMEKLDASMVSWLGADDILAPGCFQAIASVRNQFPDTAWLTGQPQRMNEAGVLMPHYGPAGMTRSPTGYPREGLRRGLNVTGANYFTVQQEGTFWELRTWKQIGGLNTNLKFAFDFDLWTRMANVTPLTELATVLGAFRTRKGQISENRAEYMAEVNIILSNLRNSRPPLARVVSTERTEILHPKSSVNEWALTHQTYLLWTVRGGLGLWGIPNVRFALYRANKTLDAASPRIIVFRTLRAWGKSIARMFRT